MTEINYDPAPLNAQQQANSAHYALAKFVRALLPQFCKDPSRCAELLRSEDAIQRLITESQQP
jgi:hypothetical protein